MHKSVMVPRDLLLHPDLPGSAKVLWIVMQSHPQMLHKELASESGLSRNTVSQGLAKLEASGWLPAKQSSVDCAVYLPWEILPEKRLGPLPKLLYGFLQLTPDFHNSRGRTTYTQLSILTGISHKPIRQSMRDLCTGGWLKATQRNKTTPIQFELRNPIADHWEGTIEALELRLQETAFRGEALMREYLSLIVDSDQYQDNATPAFLRNPLTGQQLQFDRYYPPKVAFEFNGPQHYGPTERYPNEMHVRKQQARDYIKHGISVRRGIELIVVHAEDLSSTGILHKVKGLLPLRDLRTVAPLVNYLDRVANAHRRKRLL